MKATVNMIRVENYSDFISKVAYLIHNEDTSEVVLIESFNFGTQKKYYFDGYNIYVYFRYAFEKWQEECNADVEDAIESRVSEFSFREKEYEAELYF